MLKRIKYVYYLYFLKATKKTVIDHLCKKIDNQLISLKISTK